MASKRSKVLAQLEHSRPLAFIRVDFSHSFGRERERARRQVDTSLSLHAHKKAISDKAGAAGAAEVRLKLPAE